MIIPDFGKRMVEAINAGVPAVKNTPALRRCLAPIVREIAGIKTKDSRWFSRIFRR
jgi:hypothetical protein